MKSVIITGSAGLIGSAATLRFDQLGWKVHGVDNNMRRDFFGPDGDTSANLERVKKSTKNYQHHAIDIRDRASVLSLFKAVKPDFTIHCAAQPSHDLAKDRPFDDFDVNAVGTLNLLEANRQSSLDSPFAFMSTNKVYGDAPNEIPVFEQATRYEYARPEDFDGITEDCRIDSCTHSIFGASKVAADIMVQEYGRYFGMPTVCLRGGCLTGPNHSAAELHGFLAYLARAIREGRKYTIFGYKGKQVRDNIHAEDVCEFFRCFQEKPRSGAVYNIGGGRENSISMLEAISRLQELIGKKLNFSLVDENRTGDHICYISDLRRMKADYPAWSIRHDMQSVLESLAAVK
jgi:CDP-paratose 2-epimerase